MTPASIAAPAALLATAAVSWFGARWTATDALIERKTWPKTEQAAVLPPPGAARLMAAGLLTRELAADLLWCRTLVYYGSGLLGETDLRDLERYLDVVLAIDPKFKRVYRWAAFAVTYKGTGTKVDVNKAKAKDPAATQREFRTSVRYLERAMQAFPDEYEAFWLAGIRYWLDLKDPDPAEQRRLKERGAYLIEQAMRKKDAPKDLATLAATMHTKLGQKERALANLKEMVLSVDDEEARAKLVAQVGSIGSEGMMDELQAARDALDQARQDHARYLPPDLFIILGPPPPRAIDPRNLAADRDLFGAVEDPTRLWNR